MTEGNGRGEFANFIYGWVEAREGWNRKSRDKVKK